MKNEDQRFRDAILKGVKEVLETESKDRKLEVTNVTIPRPRNPNDLQRIKVARVNQGSYTDQIYADVRISDKETGRLLREGKVHVADIPIKTPFSTYLIDGSHYQNTNQAQLKGTGYTRIKNNGNITTDFRVERGRNFENFLDPESEKFNIRINSSNYLLGPILKALDTPQVKIQQLWGPQLYRQNETDEKTDRKIQRNFAMRVFGKTKIKGKSPEEIKGMIKNHFEVESHINPEASRLTLGDAYKTVTSDVLLASTSKILGVFRQEVEPDHRDEIYFKRFRGIPETGYEYLTDRERARNIKRKLNRRIDKYDDSDIKTQPLNTIIGMDIINPVIKSIFTQAKLRGAGDTTNLLDILANETRVTIMGEGGITNRHKIMLPARDVHPSSAGFIDPVMTPQSSGGQSEHISLNTEIRDGKIKTSLIDIRFNTRKKYTPEDLFGKVIAFPGEIDKTKSGKWKPTGWQKVVTAVKDGNIVSVDIKDVDYVIPSAVEMYSLVTNLVPFLNSNSGGRSILATGQMTQAVALHDPDEPLVRANNLEKSKVFTLGAKSPVEGIVERVYKDKIKIRTKGGSRKIVPIYDNMPLNRESFIHSKPLVKKGDKVKVGDLLADNNYTKNGTLAIGKNLITAIMPYKGYNYEDGIVISEAAAKSLSSDHLYDLSIELTDKSELSSGRFAAYNRKHKITLDNQNATNIMTGLIKPDTIVQKGDILARIVVKTAPDPEDALLKTIRKGIVKPFKANPIIWENDNPGVVTISKHVGKKINLFVKSTEASKVGDKIADRHGHKGVITKILPDGDMPAIKSTGVPIDILIDPASIPSRVNVGQLLEMAAAKVAVVAGKPFVAKLHTAGDSAKQIKQLMEEFNVTDKEDIIDPLTGKTITNINVAPKYIMKLRHQVEHKMQSRGPGAGYDIDRQPIKGRAIDRLAYYALVAHGARKNLAEMAKIKAEDNPEWWAQYEAGVPTILPKEPTYTWKKFEAQLKGMGINPRREGDKMVISPLTDAEVLDMSNGKITNVDVVRKKDFKPAPGGIFDPVLTGGRGIDATQWTHIDLPEPVLNPIFLRAASKILRTSKVDLENISRGKKDVNGISGGPAIKEMLDAIDIKVELKKSEVEARVLQKSGPAASPEKMDEVNKRIRFLEGLKKYNLKPSEAYMMNYVPVIPPVFRHPIQLPDGKMSFPAANFLYKDVALMSLKSFNDAISEEAKRDVRSDLYDSVSALMGIGEPISNADAPGFMKQITGKATASQARRGITRQAKEGFFQRKVMRKRQDFSGGSVISVEPKLGVDEVEIPEKIAWDIFGPPLLRRLRMQHGMSGSDARRSYDDRTDISRSALLAEMKERPVFINRAPAWHKFNIMGAWAKLHSGDDLKVPVLPINTYFGGDFDGDTMSIHVPITDGAVGEVKNLMPSKLFTKSGSGTIMLKPQGSSMAGLFDFTKDPELKSKIANSDKIADLLMEKTGIEIGVEDDSYKVGLKIYPTIESLKSAYERGGVKPNDIVHNKGKRNTVGRAIISDILPSGWKIEGQLDSKRMNKLLEEIGKKQPTLLAPVANELSRLGNYHATYMGLSLGIDDMITDQSQSRVLIRQLKKDINYIDNQLKWKKGGRGEIEKREKKIKLFDKAIPALDIAVINSLTGNNQFKIMYLSGAKGKPTQLRQIVGPPTLFMSSSQGEILHPVENSFSHGLTPAEYYIQQTGGRFGLVQKVLGVSAPGEIGKDLLGANSSHSITEEDCGTKNGKVISINRRDLIGRYLARSNSVGKRNELITEEMVSKMRRKRIKSVFARSPLTCMAEIGVCAKCYGLNVHGSMPKLGDAVGIEDSQGVVDVIANLALKSWHLSGSKEVGELPFNKFSRLINLPRNVPDKAILSKHNGKVESIVKNELGGIDIYVKGDRHRLPGLLGIKPGLKKGDKVRKGEMLTMSGNIKPQELLELNGIEAAQDFMVDEMSNIFKSDQPGNISRKSVENIVASMTGLARVTDPGDSKYAPFDIGKSNEMAHYNRFLDQELKIKDAVGYKLAQSYGFDLPKGTEVDRDSMRQLRRQGDKIVKIRKRPMKYEPILKPIAWIPKFKNDWISRLNQKYLGQTLEDESAFGSEANIHGPDPIPAYAYGGEFGRGKGPINY